MALPENNLKDVSQDVPKHGITVFTGVSGSGGSSLVFGTSTPAAQSSPSSTISR